MQSRLNVPFNIESYLMFTMDKAFPIQHQLICLQVEATPVLHHNYEEVKPLPITPPPTVTSRTVHSPCMGYDTMIWWQCALFILK